MGEISNGYYGVFWYVTPCSVLDKVLDLNREDNGAFPTKHCCVCTQRHGGKFFKQLKKYNIQRSSAGFKGEIPAAGSECTRITTFSPVISDEF
jgi:hypothetical protein